MRETTTSATEARAAGTRTVQIGIAAVVAVLALTTAWLLLALPDADAFDARVERLFVENADLTGQAEIRLLEILAQSGTAFAEVLAGYRAVMAALLVFSAGLLAAAVTFLVMLIQLNGRMARIAAKGIEVGSLAIARDRGLVYLNEFELKLTPAALETLSVLAEARMDGDFLTGAQIEGVISGRDPSDCEEAAGATRIKRLRDALGNQLVTELLVRNVPRKGYVLAVEPSAIRVD
ncbi:MAG: winged helix-turn-helix domain-containing protein [Paracoccaceae bacterium]